MAEAKKNYANIENIDALLGGEGVGSLMKNVQITEKKVGDILRRLSSLEAEAARRERRRVGRSAESWESLDSSESLESADLESAAVPASGSAGASNSGARSCTCSSREAPAAPVPRTTRRPPRRRRTGSAGWEAAAGAAFTAAAESALDTVELSVPSLTKPSRLSVGTMLLAARCITTPISRPIRLSHTTLSPWPHENAPRKGNFVSSLSCGWRTPALALSHSQEPQGDRRHLAR
mgnify:CR=1 FL=1